MTSKFREQRERERERERSTMDAMDTDIAAARNRGPDQGATAAAGGGPAEGNAWSLLARARQLIDQGNPSLALQAVVVAMRSQGGEQAVFQTLHRARELYKNRLQSSAAAEELASLFAECAITEAQPLNFAPPPSDASRPPVLPNIDGSSILALSGREQIMLDAFSDGSSFVCLQCGGLVSSLRRDEHLAYWCGQN